MNPERYRRVPRVSLESQLESLSLRAKQQESSSVDDDTSESEQTRPERVSTKRLTEAVTVLINEEVERFKVDSQTQKKSPSVLRQNFVIVSSTPGILETAVVKLSTPSGSAGDKAFRPWKKNAKVVVTGAVETPGKEGVVYRGTVLSMNLSYTEIQLTRPDAEKVVKLGNVNLEESLILSTLNRMLAAIDQVAKRDIAKCTDRLIDLVCGRGTLKHERLAIDKDPKLNRSQQEAMEYALGSNLCLIKGPPGTGKTMVLCSIILELLRRSPDEVVLICCGSHVAVDTLVERLSPFGDQFPILRLGDPINIKSTMLKHSDRLNKERKANLPRARIIATTLHATKYDELSLPACKTIVIDEACQTLLAQCWIPLCFNQSARKLIIAGDDQQLAPTITTQHAPSIETLGITIYDEVRKLYGEERVHLLDTQYRMPVELMQFPSDELYESKLIAAEHVKQRRLFMTPGVKADNLTSIPLLWIDTSNLGHTEQAKKGSITNPAEAGLALFHWQLLRARGVKAENVGVITPYYHQKTLIEQKMPEVHISTVDGSQGQEKDVIILSLVRSNKYSNIGFLKDVRRLNVAMTRAKCQLCIIGSMDTLRKSQSKYLRDWVDYCSDKGTSVQPLRTGTDDYYAYRL